PGVTLFARCSIGLVAAPLVALLLKRTLLRGETPVFVMEMPLYKRPSLRLVGRRTIDSGWMFVRRAGTLILASMILVWFLLSFPTTDANGDSYFDAVAKLEQDTEEARDSLAEARTQLAAAEAALAEAGDADEIVRHEADIAGLRKQITDLEEEVRPLKDKLREWRSQSYLGRLGQLIEPAVQPLGWDWRIGVAALASFPAREVFVGSMGIIFGQGEGDSKDEGYRDALAGTLHRD